MYSAATTIDPHSYMAWHQWGLCNVRALEEAKAASSSGSVSRSVSRAGTPDAKRKIRASSIVNMRQEVILPLALNGLAGLMKALSLGTKRNESTITEDMLCVMQVVQPTSCSCLIDNLFSINR